MYFNWDNNAPPSTWYWPEKSFCTQLRHLVESWRSASPDGQQQKKQIFHTTSSGEKPAVQHVPNVLSCWRQRNNKDPSVLVQHWWMWELQSSFQEINFQVDRFENKKVLSISRGSSTDVCDYTTLEFMTSSWRQWCPEARTEPLLTKLEEKSHGKSHKKFAQTRREPDGWIIKHSSVHGLTKDNSER